MTDQRNLAEFIADSKITMSDPELVDANPAMEPDRRMSHWKCTLRYARRSYTVVFSMGSALRREPRIEEVLDCLASDSAAFDGAGSFEEFARELDYDPDSRRAERVYRSVQAQARKLRRLLGDELYHVLLFDVERQ